MTTQERWALADANLAARKETENVFFMRLVVKVADQINVKPKGELWPKK